MRSIFQRVVWQAALLGLMAFVAQPVLAFKADGSAKSALLSAPGTQLVQRVVQAPVLRARQQAAAVRPDLVVKWDAKRGIPASVHGSDLLGGSQGKGVGVTGMGIASGPAGEVQLKQRAVSVMGKLGGLYGIQDAGQEFTPHSVSLSASGYRHVRLNQTYKGLPVFGGQVVVHFDGKGTARTVNGMFHPIGELDVTPVLTGEQAVASAMADQTALGKLSGAVTAGPVLVIYARDVEPTLAYQLTISYKNGNDVGLWRYWIDATTGAVLLRYNNIQTIGAPAVGAPATITGKLLTQEGGATATIDGWRENTGDYFLWSFTNTWYVYDVSIPDYAYRGTNDWGTSDRTEMSAANNVQAVEDYYRDRHGRNSIDDFGMMAIANVHNTGQQNAFWDGSEMQYYDELPCVLDVTGHELTHGVTQYSADLIYSYESGALNESMSDIFGTCVEFFYQPDGRAQYPNSTPGRSDWLMGEDTAPEVGVIRDMRNPKKYDQPSKYQGTLWYKGAGDNGGVHYNSGVQNFFFYLLCEGGVGTNDDIVYYLPGIGIRAAEKIAYLTLTSYMIPSTDYAAARDYWVAAAQETDAAGVTTNAEITVAATWAAVGVGTYDYVSPRGRYSAGGPVGTGPYVPVSKEYHLLNPGTNSLTWSVFGTGTAWLDISASSVIVPSGATGLVTLAINQAVATNMAPGVYQDLVTFTNRISALTTTRQVFLHIGNNYAITSVNYDWIDPVAGGHDLVSAETGMSSPYVLPFPVCFYDALYSELTISAHGLLGFVPDGLDSPDNVDLPTDTAPFAMLCPLWDAIDARQAPAKLYYKVVGSAPNRKIVATWVDAPHASDLSARYSVQAIIMESASASSNNDIIFQYKDVAEQNDIYGSGKSATIGIEDEYGALSKKYSYNGVNWVGNGTAMKFTQYPQSDTTGPVGTIRTLGGNDLGAMFEIKFNEFVSGLDTNDLIMSSNIPGIVLNGLQGGGMRFVVPVTNFTGLGRVMMSVRGNAVADWAGNSNAPFGPAIYVVQPQGLDFADDMENGPAVWTASTQVFEKISTKSWEWVNPADVGGPVTHSGTHYWGAILGGTPGLNAWVMSAPIPVRTYPKLDFWVNHSGWGSDYGYGYVEVNGGAGWTNVTPNGRFSGPSAGWENVVILLDNNQFGSRSIQVRFRTLTAGMYVDDVKVYSKRDPGVWVVDYTPKSRAPSSVGSITYNAYNSTTNTYNNVVGVVGSPESGVTFGGTLPVSYGTILPGDQHTGAAQMTLGSVGNFQRPTIQLTHEAKSGIAILGQQNLPFYVSNVTVSVAATNVVTVKSTLFGEGVTNWLGLPLLGNGGPTSCLYQVIYAGTNGVVDPPLANGQVTGDDKLLYSSGFGLPWGLFGEGGVPSDRGQFRKLFDHGLASNSLIYVRAFDGSSFDSAVAYGDSTLYPLTGLAAQTHDFGSWLVGTPLNAGRDSNGDTITDGYAILHGMDPRDPIVPLFSSAVPTQQLGSVSGAGQFASSTPSPTRLFYKGNFIFALDTGHNKIQVWNRVTGQYVGSYGSTGSGNGQFVRPYGLGLDPRPGMNRFAVVDQGNFRVQVFQFDPLTGTNITYLTQFGSSADFVRPTDVAIAPDGRFYVTDLTDWDAVQIFSPSGFYQSDLATWGTNSVSVKNPWGVTVGTNGMVVVADTENNRIQAWDSLGNHLWSVGGEGTNINQFKMPHDVAFGPGNMIYVADTVNSRLVVYRTDGSYVATLGAHGFSFDVKMVQPFSLVPVLDSNIVYVADTLNSRILAVTTIFDADGDGMDDVWEILHGLDPTDPTDGLLDYNGNGISNIGEYRLGQDPGLPLRITAFSVNPAFINWEEVVTGGIYRVEYSFDHVTLASNSWQSGPTVTSSVSGVLGWTNTLSLTNAIEYFRVIRVSP